MARIWRMEEPELNAKGTIIKGGMFGPQRDWWTLPNFVKALVTGYGGGKTFIGAKRCIALAIHNALSEDSGEICPHLVVSPSYKIAKRTIIPTIRALLVGKQRLDPTLRFRYHKTDHEFTIWYRGRVGVIWINSGDDPDSLRGPNVGSALIDEPFIQDEEVLDQVDARVRHPQARVSEIGLTGTPEQLNWGYDICEGDRREDYDIGVVHASTRANMALDRGYADRLERAFTEKAAQAYVDGMFVSLQEGQIYYSFDRRQNVVELPDPGGELLVGNDFNVNPMAAVVAWHQRGHIHIMDEIELPNADTEYLCSEVLSRYPDSEAENKCRVSTFFPDASGKARSTKAPGGKSDFHYIKEAGFVVEAPNRNPLIRDRENAVNGSFKSREEGVTLTVSPKCKRLISYLTKLTHENKNTAKGKAMTHLTEAMGYLVHKLNPVSRETVNLVRVSGA